MKQAIFITGAASGIGRQTALYFAGKGWFTGLYDLDGNGLDALSEEIGQRHGKDCVCKGVLDVTDPSSVRAGAADFLAQTSGRLDLLFNSAGLLAMGRHETIELSRQKAIIDVNLTGVLNMIHAFLPALKATPGAAVLTMSSASAVYGTPELAVYSATKHGIRGLTEALNIEFAPLDIHVGDIMVSFVQTPMVTRSPTVATSLRRLRATATPEQVAKTVFAAYHRRRVHRQMGGLLRLLTLTCALLPFAKRFLVKTLAFSSGRQGG